MKKKIAVILFTIILCSYVYALDLSGLLSGLSTENSTTTAQEEKTMTATNLDTKAEYDISPDYIYEGVLFDNKFPQKKYTYIKNLDVMILYGNRSLYEEMKSYTPWITKESFDATFSQEDMKDIIATAAGGETKEIKYGDNVFYETEKVQEIEENGVKKNVNSIVDMYFDDGYIYSFSYSYKDKKDGFSEYQTVLKTFKTLTDEEAANKPKISKQDQALALEREQMRLEEERRKQEEQTLNKTEEQEKTQETIEDKVIKEEIKEQITEETTIIEQEVDKEKEKQEQVVLVSGDINSGEETTNIITSGETPMTISGEEEDGPIVISEIKKRSIFEIVIGVIWNNPVLRIVVIALIIFDITIIVLLRKRAKRRKNKAKMNNKEQ